MAQGYVENPESFRVTICGKIKRTGEQCPSRKICKDAHSCSELRIEEAINRGLLHPDYKTKYCEQKSGTVL